jgi:hypothetical protein
MRAQRTPLPPFSVWVRPSAALRQRMEHTLLLRTLLGWGLFAWLFWLL